ncbi:DUF1127 domain-containing protein [Methylobrevis pamukkalensis]|uniref:YjiS-like domain-containing protein n=1 Tax=Methylobrevis pamukkalensis TaxID=1439726 RepID=A0A1E3H2F9_9HYPH|nr:DUF1127 domain-containing protein [Methylobrevis pamukkalensis]ODN70474.1 hypothetical protein A6302_02216 [Methylobrevis pamukkalensis]
MTRASLTARSTAPCPLVSRADARRPARSPLRAVPARLHAAWQVWCRYRSMRRTAVALEGLSDESLKDIGLSRSQIEFAARTHDIGSFDDHTRRPY